MNTESPLNRSPAVGTPGLLGVVGTVVALAFAYRASMDGFIPVLDHANLAFHEAGHVFFGVLGPTLGLYGGTLGQLVFPVVVTVVFLRKGAPLSAAFALLWLFQNLLNIARYVADARAQQLPLVGSGDHDWFNILSRWGALPADTALARLLSTLAWLGMLATAVWIGIVWYRDREK
jgi:hypothetical protein